MPAFISDNIGAFPPFDAGPRIPNPAAPGKIGPRPLLTQPARWKPRCVRCLTAAPPPRRRPAGDDPRRRAVAGRRRIEPVAGQGATETIRRDKPKLSLAVYHTPDDLTGIVDAVRAVRPDYRFTLRHHSPIFHDTVLYAE